MKKAVLKAAEVEELRKLLERDRAARLKVEEDPCGFDVYDVWSDTSYHKYDDCSYDEEPASVDLRAHAAWTDALKLRKKAIEECMANGYHTTKSVERKTHSDREILALMICKCGAAGRVVIGVGQTPPAKWT